ncbi:MAG: nuclear transport factor 2 family protein [Sphingomonas fennica]
MPDLKRTLLAAVALFALAGAAPARGDRLTADERNALARDLDRVESVRAVKDVQRLYAQLSQFGRWQAMADLFAADGTLAWGEQRAHGRTAIAAFLAERAGAMTGAAPGTLHTEIIDEPLVNLSADGRTARVRWMGMRFMGDGKGRARIEGGLYENEYVREDGGWRIATLAYHPQYEGDYAGGWANVGGRDLPIVPAHFTVDESGTPIPPATGAAPSTRLSDGEIAARIARLNDEDAIRNVQNAYGYYVDRRMWTDAAGLFAADGAIGTARGPAGIRRALEAMGPEGLATGDLNERPIFDLIVEVQPGGREARARGIELGLLADGAKRQGAWEFAVFESRFVKDGGLWKLKALDRTPLLRADYATGWGDGGTAPGARAVPAFLAVRAGVPVATAGAVQAADLRRRLARSAAYDGVENVSSAYGFYIDDFQWPQMAGIFAEKGNKQAPFAGYYLGRDRILGAVNASWGPAPAMRAAISFHWRTQPVIHVSHDGRSANLRTRLFQPRTSKNAVETPASFYMGGLHGGMYPNDQAVLENGIWRLWSLTIDEHYFASPNWKGGWAAAAPNETAVRPSPLLTKYPPDVKISDLGRREEGFRGGTGTPVDWPGILPMWFHYRNPVSGRTPDRFWPDCVPCEAVPAARMTAHGYQQPPTGPEIDGVEVPPARP